MNEIAAAQTNASSGFSANLAQSLSKTGAWEKAAGAAGTKLNTIESQLISELSKADPDEGKVQKLEIMYKRAQRVYEIIRELINSMHETLMRGIQSLRIG